MERRLETLEDARSFVKDALAARRTPPWRELHARLKEVKSEDAAIEAIGALRELLMMEGRPKSRVTVGRTTGLTYRQGRARL